jgi:alkylhydroperoxidase family enzyme
VKAAQIKAAVEARDIISAPLDTAQKSAMIYAQKLTQTPSDLIEDDIIAMRDAGFSDGEILEINQVSAYFSYANRTVLGLGCNTKGDIIGLSPNNSDDPNDWGHT